MDLAHESDNKVYVLMIPQVSILVLVDLAHESLRRWFLNMAKKKVSILVLVDLAHEFHAAMSISRSRNVSILVLVDLAHEFFWLPFVPPQLCFNPCFSGSCSRIVKNDGN